MRLGLFVLLLGFAAHADNLVTAPGAPFPGTIDMPRATAMGGAMSAIATSNDALLNNPAGLPQNKRYHFELDGADDVHFPAQGITASIVDSSGGGGVATGAIFNRWGSGQPAGRGEGWSAGLAYAGQLSGTLFAGGETKFIRYHTPDGLITKFAEDAGVLGKQGNFSWALMVQNLSFDNIPLFPLTGTAGVALGTDATWHLAFDYKLDFSDTNNLKSTGALGGELLIEDGLVLRAGLRRDFTADINWVSAGFAVLTTGAGLQISWRRRVNGSFDQIFEAGITLFLE
jgi:hypothetical protein